MGSRRSSDYRSVVAPTASSRADEFRVVSIA
jgi:hypothetical protein